MRRRRAEGCIAVEGTVAHSGVSRQPELRPGVRVDDAAKRSLIVVVQRLEGRVFLGPVGQQCLDRRGCLVERRKELLSATHLAIKFPGILGPRAQEQFRIAAEQADGVLADAQAYVGGTVPPGLLPSAADFVRRTVKPATEVLTWGITLCRYGRVAANETDKGQKQGREQALATRAKATALGDTNTSYRVRYNLACYWSSWLEQMPGEDDPDTDGRKPSQRVCVAART